MNPHAEMINRLRDYCDGGNPDKDSDLVEDAITALEAAGEPVEHQFQDATGKWYSFMDQKHHANTVADGRWPVRAPYTRPAPLVLMTDEELDQLVFDCGLSATARDIARSIEDHYLGAKP